MFGYKHWFHSFSLIKILKTCELWRTILFVTIKKNEEEKKSKENTYIVPLQPRTWTTIKKIGTQPPPKRVFLLNREYNEVCYSSSISCTSSMLSQINPLAQSVSSFFPILWVSRPHTYSHFHVVTHFNLMHHKTHNNLDATSFQCRP